MSHDVEKLRCRIAEVPLYMLAVKKFIRYLTMLCSFLLEICISPPLNLVMTHWLNNHWRWWKVNIQLKRNLEYLRKQQIWHKVVHSNQAHGEVYLIQHYVIKCVSDLRQFSLGTPVSSNNKTDYPHITGILLKVAFNTITLLTHR